MFFYVICSFPIIVFLNYDLLLAIETFLNFNNKKYSWKNSWDLYRITCSFCFKLIGSRIYYEKRIINQQKLTGCFNRGNIASDSDNKSVIKIINPYLLLS